VWTDVLDYSCSYAADKTTAGAVVEAAVSGVHSSGLEYDGGQHYTYPDYTTFHLSNLLNDMATSGTDYADCRDCSNWFHVLTSSVGVSAHYRRLTRTTSPYTLVTNYIFPMGWGGETHNVNWNYHQVGWWSSDVGDAACDIDNDADPTASPFTWKLARGDMTQGDYVDKLTETPDVTDVATGTCSVQ
jgi:hypothetical protein